jgi:hypothetical protein
MYVCHASVSGLAERLAARSGRPFLAQKLLENEAMQADGGLGGASSKLRKLSFFI